MREPIIFISRKKIWKFLLNNSIIYTRDKYWIMTSNGVGCFITEDNKLLGHIQIDKAVDILFKEDCQVNLD